MRILLLALGVLLPTAAFAHTGHGDTAGFTHGFFHPLGGFDHALAMVAVGLFAAHLGGLALWMVPAAFVSMMAAGGALGMAGIAIPYVETGIALSVVVLGAAVAFGLSLPVAAAMSLVGFIAIFQGHAQGAEMPETASGLSYGVGFLLATALLHAAGIGLGLGIGRLQGAVGRRVQQVAGGGAALAGIGMLAGWI
jgi:urease accessory protein